MGRVFDNVTEEVTERMICLGKDKIIIRLLPMDEAWRFWGYHDDI